MPSALQFENLKPLVRNRAVADIEVEGARLDLHQGLRLVGLTLGLDPTMATLGWAVTAPTVVIRQGQALPIEGLALHCSGVFRFEVAFEAETPGQLEYFEYRPDPEPTLIFFFESGTARIGCTHCRAELVTEADEAGMSGSQCDSGHDPGLVQ